MKHAQIVHLYGAQGDRRSRQPLGFTLVELLVVVSIIALLISILLPSLKNAREQAKTLKCLSNVTAISKAGATYQSEENDWFVGSPGTSGSLLRGAFLGSPPDREDIPIAPVQTWDYAGPLASVQMSMKSMPQNRADRWGLLIQDIFECPNNKFLSEPYFGGTTGPHGKFKVQRMVSYNTVRNLLLWGGTTAQAPYSEASFFAQAGGSGNPTKFPSGYSPRADRLGQPSEKVFIADGSRFVDEVEGIVDHDINWNAGSGGGFSDGGPTLPDQYLRSYLRRDPRLRDYSYRHRRGKEVGICAAYFDGHAERLSEKQSREPNRWWPKGTILPWSELNDDSRLPLIDIMPPEWNFEWHVLR